MKSLDTVELRQCMMLWKKSKEKAYRLHMASEAMKNKVCVCAGLLLLKGVDEDSKED